MATNSASAKSRGSLLDRLLTSPRAQRRLTWLSAVVLLAGIVAVTVAFVFHEHTAPVNHVQPTTPGQTTPIARAPVHVKPSADAYKVAREFLETAVLRKRLHFAWTLVAAPLKAGISRKSWETGFNQVVPYPATNAATARFHPIVSTKHRLFIATNLEPRKGSYERPLTFFIELRPTAKGNWLVDYFESENPIGGSPGSGGQ